METIEFTFKCVDCSHPCTANYLSIGDALTCPNCQCPLQIPEETLPIGTCLAENYEILALVGKGSMGVVYLAKELSSGKQHALKVLRPKLARDQQHKDDFAREAEIMVKIDHSGIAAAKDYIEKDGVHFMVMDYIEGEEIATRLWEKVVYEEKETLEIMQQAAEALMYLDREYGIIHRDIKPENLMISPEGEVVLMDLGVCQEGEEGSEDIVGTPEYMSPEQALGKGADFRSDIYSLAMSAYHMMSGVMPMIGKNQFDTMRKVKTENVPLIQVYRPNISDKTTAFLHKCLAKDPHDRFVSWEEFASALKNCVNRDHKIAVATEEPKSKTALYGIVAFVAVLLIVLVVQILHRSASPVVQYPIETPKDIIIVPDDKSDVKIPNDDPKNSDKPEKDPVDKATEPKDQESTTNSSDKGDDEVEKKSEDQEVEKKPTAEEIAAAEAAREAAAAREAEKLAPAESAREAEEERQFQEKLRRSFIQDLETFFPLLVKKPIEAKKLLLTLESSSKYGDWEKLDESLVELNAFVELDAELLKALQAKKGKRVMVKIKGKKRRAILNSVSYRSGLFFRYKLGTLKKFEAVSLSKIPMSYVEKYVATEGMENKQQLLQYFCVKFSRKDDCLKLLENSDEEGIVVDLLNTWIEE